MNALTSRLPSILPVACLVLGSSGLLANVQSDPDHLRGQASAGRVAGTVPAVGSTEGRMQRRLDATAAPEDGNSVFDRIVADARTARAPFEGAVSAQRPAGQDRLELTQDAVGSALASTVQGSRGMSAASVTAVVYQSRHRNHLLIWD